MPDIKSLLIEYIPRLRRYARTLTKNAADADDLVQDCLERGWSRIHTLADASNIRAWLFTIMHNVFVNKIRSKKHESHASSVAHEESLSSIDNADEKVVLRDITNAMSMLPVDYREVLLLVAVEGLRYEEVAAILNIPIGTVMSRLSRAREQLHQLLHGAKAANVRIVK